MFYTYVMRIDNSIFDLKNEVTLIVVFTLILAMPITILS